jgi:AcrR family transcriptional regulator
MTAKSIRQTARIMDTGQELFWKYGLKRVSVEEICKKAGISKMTFYRHFENKIELAKAIYDRIIEESTIAFRDIMTDETTSVHQKVESMLKLKLESTQNISREFLEDFYTNPETGLPSYIEKRTTESWNDMIGLFREAQAKGLFRKDFKPEAFFMISMKTIDLLKDERLLALFDTPQDLVMELTRIFTFGIIDHTTPSKT